MSGIDGSELRKFVATEIIFGIDAIDRVGVYAQNFGARKALVVTDPGVTAAGWSKRVADELRDAGVLFEIFDGVTPNPKDQEVRRGVECYQQLGCDVIVAVGGGSVMDCAKGIGVSATNERDVLTFEGIDEIDRPGPPLICVPTTAGSSADVSQFAIITDTNRQTKIAIVSKVLVPDVALIDPRTTATMDAHLTACTGMDALTHAIEAYVSNASSTLTDVHALRAMELIAGSLVHAVKSPDDLEGRTAMMAASMHAGLAFSNASLGAVHAMAHCLGGLKDLPHGLCNAVLLEHVVAYNYAACSERYDDVARQLGVDIEGAEPEARLAGLLAGIRRMREDVGIAGELTGAGVSSEDIPRLAAGALADACIVTNPKRPTQEEIEVLYGLIF